MRFGQIYKFAATAAATAAAIVATLLSGCQHDHTGTSLRNDKPSGPIEFQMSVFESESVRTRLDSVFINHDHYNVDFVIELNTKDDKTQEKIQETGIYIVPSGYEGRLTAKQEEANNDALNWKNLTEEHTFYGWTKSWLPPTQPAQPTQPADENRIPTVYPDYPTGDDAIDPKYGGSDSKGKFFWVTFYDSPEDTVESDDNSGEGEGEGEGEAEEEEKVPGYSIYHNNDYLETFIGTQAGPYSYVNHGRYVMLTFKHLVSKIKIDRMALVKPDGSVDFSVRGDMTFIGLPKRAKFYPHPIGDGWPYVEHDREDGVYDANEDYDVTYFIANKPGKDNEGKNNEDYFYICPEVDFSKIKFKIKLNDSQYGREGNYYGDFNKVKFVREAGTDYDQGNGKDDTILHAGEEMTLSIELVPGVGPGIALIIKGWNTEKPDDTVHHTKPGIYTDGEVKEFLDIFLNQTKYDEDEIEDALERFLEMYGEEGEDGKMHFPLFDNVTVDGTIFPIFKDCIIDGQGHTINIGSNGAPGTFTNVNNPRFNIGPVRDVWLTDGTNTIYIDKEGWVWFYKDGVLQRGEQLTDLENGEKSYDISSVDGKIYKSTFYNWTVTQ